MARGGEHSGRLDAAVVLHRLQSHGMAPERIARQAARFVSAR